MKYLINTDIASYYLRGRYNLIDVFEKKGVDNIRLSRTTVAELEVLAYKNPQTRINLPAIHSFSISIGILEVDRQTWRIFSTVKADILKRGLNRGDLDILNASLAKQYNLIIVTNNISHYQDLVAVENWIATH